MITVQVLYDIQLDLTEVQFLRHYVYSHDERRVKRTFDTDIHGAPYVRTGIRTGTGSYDVYAGIVCMLDPDLGVTTRVKQFFSNSGQISYTTVDGVPIYEWPTGAVFSECGGIDNGVRTDPV